MGVGEESGMNASEIVSRKLVPAWGVAAEVPGRMPPGNGPDQALFKLKPECARRARCPGRTEEGGVTNGKPAAARLERWVDAVGSATLPVLASAPRLSSW